MLAIALASFTPASALPQQPSSGTLRADLDRIVRDAAPKGFFGAVLIARNGEIILDQGYGEDVAGRAIDTDTLFDVASVGKHFTAAAALSLIDKKRLGLDDRLDQHFRGVPDDKAGITVRQMLNHRAGFTRDIDWNDDDVHSRDTMLKRAFAEPLASQPGDGFAYSNVGYQILAALIEIRSGRRFESVVHRSVFKPAGLAATGFVGEPHLDATDAAPRWQEQPDPRYPDTAVDWAWHWAFRGAAGIVTSAKELYRWDRALSAEDGSLPAAVRDPITTVDRSVRDAYFFGLEQSRTQRFTTRLSHSGSCYGFRALFVRFPAEDACIIVLGNSLTRVGLLDLDLERRLFAAPPPAAALQACAGRFALPDSDSHFVLRSEGDALFAEAAGHEAMLHILYGDRRSSSDTMNRAAFERHARSLLEPLRSRSFNGETLLPAFTAEAASSKPTADSCSTLAALADQHGACTSIEWTGSDPKRALSWCTLTFGRGSRARRHSIALRWNDSLRHLTGILLGDDVPPPPSIQLRWLHASKFAGRALQAPVNIRLHRQRKGRNNLLLWNDRGQPKPIACTPSRER